MSIFTTKTHLIKKGLGKIEKKQKNRLKLKRFLV